MTISEIISNKRGPKDIIADLKRKNIYVIPWSELEKEYNTRKHPVKTDPTYRDRINKRTGKIERVSRITLGLQKLAVKRMTELLFGIPVQRVYRPKDESEKKVSEIMEAIFEKNRIDSVNISRDRC